MNFKQKAIKLLSDAHFEAGKEVWEVELLKKR